MPADCRKDFRAIQAEFDHCKFRERDGNKRAN